MEDLPNELSHKKLRIYNMTQHQTISKINEIINNLPERKLEDVLVYLQQIEENDEKNVSDIAVYTSDGTPLSKKEYEKHLNKISIAMNEGETYTPQEVKDFVLNRK